jgi:hypothetical protein
MEEAQTLEPVVQVLPLPLTGRVALGNFLILISDSHFLHLSKGLSLLMQDFQQNDSNRFLGLEGAQ